MAQLHTSLDLTSILRQRKLTQDLDSLLVQDRQQQSRPALPPTWTTVDTPWSIVANRPPVPSEAPVPLAHQPVACIPFSCKRFLPRPTLRPSPKLFFSVPTSFSFARPHFPCPNLCFPLPASSSFFQPFPAGAPSCCLHTTLPLLLSIHPNPWRLLLLVPPRASGAPPRPPPRAPATTRASARARRRRPCPRRRRQWHRARCRGGSRRARPVRTASWRRGCRRRRRHRRRQSRGRC